MFFLIVVIERRSNFSFSIVSRFGVRKLGVVGSVTIFFTFRESSVSRMTIVFCLN